MEHIFIEPEGIYAAKARFAEFLVLDAVIGNTDRHHENWGVARRRDGGSWVGYMAPTFDHASALGRELTDKRREGLLANNRIGNYSENGSGGIYWSESDRKAPSPLELVRLAFGGYRTLLGPSLEKLKFLEDEKITEVVERVPHDWMTDAARRFTIQLVSYNCKQLQEIG